MLNTPILFLVFNRLETTKQVFAKIREIQPKYLFIGADGPRMNKAEDKEKTELVRNYILNNIDWNCEVKTLFREENVGCRRAVGQAITWFFEYVEEGIILEDDTVPDLSFFKFCEELLIYYRNDDKIWTISGNNFQNNIKRENASYYFSMYFHCWGWATWRRAWQYFDKNLDLLEEFKVKNLINKINKKPYFKKYWLKNFQAVKNKQIDTWDYIWTFTCWYYQKINILPNVNLVTNIGFNEQGTHTMFYQNMLANLPISRISFPLLHPKKIQINKLADIYTDRHAYKIYFFRNKILNFIKNISFTKINSWVKRRIN